MYGGLKIAKLNFFMFFTLILGDNFSIFNLSKLRMMKF